MPNKEKNIPKRRFKAFENADAWELRKLGEVSKKISEKNVDNLYSETFTNSAEHGIISQRDFFDKDISNATNLNTYYIVQNNDFVYNPRISNYAPVGPVKRNKLGRTGVMSPLYYVFRTHDIDEGYLETYFDTTYWHSFMKLNGDSGARADRFAIKDSVFAEMPLPIPSLPEQEAIGTFFSTLDQHIALHQRKLDKLKSVKQAYLSEMFPAEGERVPKRRFPGFTDDWELRKLGELMNENSERTSDFANNPLYSLTIENGITPKTERYERSSLVTKQEDLFKIVKPNEFVTNPMNLRFGALGYNSNSFRISVSGYYDVFSIDENRCSNYWYAFFKTDRALSILDNVSTGSLIEKRRVKYSTLRQISFRMPCELDEKIKIGNFFSTLDSHITLHQRKLEKLKNLKKALLNELFV
ncbi:TPA: restriction endonuclease subunit S [Streptococcus suis]